MIVVAVLICSTQSDQTSKDKAAVICCTRSGSAIASISTIFPLAMVKPIMLTGEPSIVTITSVARSPGLDAVVCPRPR